MEMLSVPIGVAKAGETYVRSDIDLLAFRRHYLADAGLSHMLTTKDWKGLFLKIHPHTVLLDGDAHLIDQANRSVPAAVLPLNALHLNYESRSTGYPKDWSLLRQE